VDHHIIGLSPVGGADLCHYRRSCSGSGEVTMVGLRGRQTSSQMMAGSTWHQPWQGVVPAVLCPGPKVLHCSCALCKAGICRMQCNTRWARDALSLVYRGSTCPACSSCDTRARARCVTRATVHRQLEAAVHACIQPEHTIHKFVEPLQVPCELSQ
jgi:hypothetical protein